jgi:hypothetical protein
MTGKNVVKASGFLNSRAFFHNRAKVALLGGAVLALAVLSVRPAAGQRSALPTVVGIPEDWSHHHLIFSVPQTAEEATRVQNDPRYWHQWFRRNVQRVLPDGLPAPTPEAALEAALKAPLSLDEINARNEERRRAGGKTGLWGMSLGATTANVAAGHYPAKYTLYNSVQIATVSCSDFVVFTTSTAGSATQASIVAFDNLYAGTCGGNNPLVDWSYSTGGTASNSPVLSADGKQVAFIQVVGTSASLVLLHGVSGQGTTASNPVTPGTQSSCATTTITSYTCAVAAAAYRTCLQGAGSCQLTMALAAAATPNDTNSDPFYDYFNDALYVGDNSGVMHKFSPVFNGAPAEVTNQTTTSGWPTKVTSSASTLTSPTVDLTTSTVFVGTGITGTLVRFPTTGGGSPASGTSSAVVASGSLSTGTGIGIVDAPIVDSANAGVYVFVADDNGPGSEDPSNGIYKFTETFAATTTGSEVQTGGTTGTSAIMYDGAFDNAFYGGSGTTGNLYVCGTHSSGSDPRLYKIALKSTFASSTVTVVTPTGNDLTSGAATCSPITEIFTNSIDYIYFSVSATGDLSTCNDACVYSYNVTGTTPSLSSGINSAGGSSGIVIDNSVSSTPGAAQVYFSSLAATAGTRSVTVTTSRTTNPTGITATTGAFTAADVGAPISGAGFPANTTIASVTSSTAAIASAACNTSSCGSGKTLTVTYVCPAGGGNAVITAASSCAIQASQAALK